MKNIYALLITSIFIVNAGAQKIEGIAGFIQSGYMNAPNAANVFSQIYPDNAAGFANNYWLVGTDAYYRHKSNVFMGDLQFGLQKVYSFNDKHAGAVYEAVIGKYGRIIKEEKNFWLYPSAGAGVSVIALTSYEDISGERKNMETLTLTSPSFDIGMNADFLLSKLKWNENYYLGWISGIKAGYRFSAKSKKWKRDEDEFYKGAFNKLYEISSYTDNVVYLSLSFGIGSFDKK